jgi:hypothetical protein
MRLVFAAIIVGGITLILAACSSGSATESTTGATTTPTEAPLSAEFIAAAQEAATNSLLTLEDYPAGWTQTPRDPDDPDLGLTGECAVIEDDALPGEVAHAISDDFDGPDDQEVSTGSSVFAESGKAAQAFADYADTLDACRGRFSEAYKTAIQKEFDTQGVAPESISDLVVTFDPIESPVSADDTLTYRLLMTLTASGQPLKFTFDVFFVRQGNVVGYLSYYAQGDPPIGEEGQLAEALMSKLQD